MKDPREHTLADSCSMEAILEHELELCDECLQPLNPNEPGDLHVHCYPPIESAPGSVSTTERKE